MLQSALFIAVVGRATFNYSGKDSGEKSFVQEKCSDRAGADCHGQAGTLLPCGCPGRIRHICV